MERIGENFFGLQFPKRKKPMGLFGKYGNVASVEWLDNKINSHVIIGSIIQGIMESPDDDEEDDFGEPLASGSGQSSQPAMTVEDLDW